MVNNDPKEETKHNDDLLGAKLPYAISAVISPRKHEFKLEMDSEVDIIRPEEVKHLKERLRLAVIIYEEKLNTFLFNSNEIKMSDFLDKIMEYFLLGKGDAILITRFLFERRNKPKVAYRNDLVRRSTFITRRLREFIGKYDKIDATDMSDIKVDYNCIEDQGIKEKFINALTDFSQ